MFGLCKCDFSKKQVFFSLDAKSVLKNYDGQFMVLR